MKKTSPSKAKSRKASTQRRRGLRQLGGGLDEQSWLTMFAMLILAVVLCVFLVAIMKTNGAFDSNKSTDSNNQLVLTSPAAREERIRTIFDSIAIDDSFEITREDIFGDKRVYEWDDGRTYSSSREYLRDAEVRDTKQIARDAIEAAGFTFFDEPYAGSVASQYHFKNDYGEYVRLSVMSQNVMSSSQNNRQLTEEERYAAPSIVIIKVNLDDNNE